jgi:hypothetical protein
MIKAQYRGDPGLFGDVGKFLGGAIKGGIGGLLTGNPLAGIAGAVGGGVRAVSGGSRTSMPVLRPAVNVVGGGFAAPPPIMQQPDSIVRNSGISIGGPGGVQIGSRTTLFPGGPMMPPTTYAPAQPQGLSCPPKPNCSGYHLNKTGYYRKGGPCSPYPEGGYVEKGTTWVKNRRRNPLNPRAASRAIARLTSARKATRSILKFFGGSSRSARTRSSSGGKACGCKRR